jgi:DHA3 family macrolide efflux protein-like MFS transporter
MATIDAAWGIGMIAGGVLLSAWGGFKRRIVTSLLGVVGIGLGFVVMGLAPSNLFVMAVGASFFLGAMNPIANGPMMAVLQSTVAPDMQGRVMSLIMAASVAMTPLSLLVAGPIADVLGVQVWYILGGVVTVLIGIGSFFVPALMNIESQKAQGRNEHEVTSPLADVV